MLAARNESGCGAVRRRWGDWTGPKLTRDAARTHELDEGSSLGVDSRLSKDPSSGEHCDGRFGVCERFESGYSGAG